MPLTLPWERYSAVARALQVMGLLLCFGASKKTLLGVQMAVGFRCYSRKVSLGGKVFARQDLELRVRGTEG